MRYDDDDQLYPKSSFIQYYQEEGAARWENAGEP